MKSPKVSIITVVYNGENTLEKTIKSIVNQNYDNLEYIIIDGASKDNTINIIHNYEDSISKYISEPDAGIYNAMNKGIEMATGNYLWFMNSGDEIADKNTLKQIFDTHADGDIYYGDTMMIDAEGNHIGTRRLQPPENLNWKSFKKGMLVSHQSFIVKKDLIDLYNEKYRFSADFEWCLVALKRAQKIIHTHQLLSLFLDGGVTKQNIKAGLKERFKIMCQYYGTIPTLYQHFFIAIKFFWFWGRNGRF